jgi:hypothetical protein
MLLPRPFLTALALAAFVAGCASTMSFNQSFLASEDLKIAQKGFVSLKSTGETFDFSGIREAEPGARGNVVLMKVHGTFIATGDGFTHVYKIWPACGRDKAKYKFIKLDPGSPQGFRAPQLTMAGNCALLKWENEAGTRQAFIDADGDADETKCDDD